MKHTKLLKSAVLSTALLWGGATQAQTIETGTMSLEIVAASALSITAGNLSFGTHTSGAAETITLACPSAGDTTSGARKVNDGSCADIAVSATSGTINYSIAVSSAALALTGQTSIAAPNLVLYAASDGTTTVSGTVAQSVTSGTAVNYVLGGNVAVPADTAAGTYSGDYTVTATVS